MYKGGLCTCWVLVEADTITVWMLLLVHCKALFQRIVLARSERANAPGQSGRLCKHNNLKALGNGTGSPSKGVLDSGLLSFLPKRSLKCALKTSLPPMEHGSYCIGRW